MKSRAVFGFASPATKKFPALVSAAMAIAVTAALVLLSRSPDVAILPYVLLLSLGTFAVTISVWRSSPLGSNTVFGVALIAHAIAIFGFAAFEDDYFRFIWDGWMLSQNGTPYGIAPANFFGETLADDRLGLILDGVNNPHLPTIYGPTLQFLFSLIYQFSGTDPLGLRIVFAIANLILVALLLRWTSPNKTALYAWSPLVLTEIIIHIHPDGIMAMLLLAGLVVAKRYPWLAGLFFGLAAGAKIVALALFPLLLRMKARALVVALTSLVIIYGVFLLQGQGAGFDSTGVFASNWYYNPLAFALLDFALPPPIARTSAAVIGIAIVMIFHARTRTLDTAPIALIFGVILVLAPAVNAWYLLWILPFATKGRMIWPFVAAAALPLSYLTGLNLDDPLLNDFEVHGWAWAVQVAMILGAIGWDYLQFRKTRIEKEEKVKPLNPLDHPNIAIVIPALDEEKSIGQVVRDIRAQNWPSKPHVIVADNGSSDDTISLAQIAGAQVVREPNRGYGAACLAGIAAIPDDANLILFMDGDGADIAEEGPGLIAPLIDGQADLVIGSRALGRKQAGAMTFPQIFGNWLATRLMWLIWGKRMTDLGPFRAIRRDVLDQLHMADRDFGWTIEMQVKAVQHNMRIVERPAGYRRRVGVSKISGTIRGVLMAGNKILFVIGREAFFR
ncbi:MAG: glycosyltransferase [Parasphingorhabdus sp.]|uniref:glycosyltransferase n=1 Tax=Parasphingorhabdus sp. TaxID=2709688 RepID=UPI003298B4E2